MQPLLQMRHGAYKSAFILCFLFLTWLSPAKSQTWLWGKGTTGALNYNALTTDAFGHEYFTGSFRNTTASFGTYTLSSVGTATTSCIYVAKYDSTGNVLWAKNATGSSSNNDGQAIITDRAGNVLVTGTYTDTISFGTGLLTGNPTGVNSFVAKYDSAGNVVWAQSIRSDDSGTDFVSAGSVATDAAGNIYISGSYAGTAFVAFDTVTIANPDGTRPGMFVAKYSPSGSLVWTKMIKGPHAGALKVATDTLGHFYFSGGYGDTATFDATQLITPPSTHSIFIAKYDTAGTLMWVKSKATNAGTTATGMSANAVGDIFFTGFYHGLSVPIDSITLTSTSTDSNQLFIAKFDSSGHVAWAKNTIGPRVGIPSIGVFADNSGNVFQCGIYLTATATFDTCVLYNPTSATSIALFIAKYDPVGNVKWAVGADASVYALGGDVAVNSAGQLYLVAQKFSGTGTGTVHLGADSISGSYQVFLARMGDSTFHIIIPPTTVPEVPGTPAITLFPNPATTQLTISSTDNITVISITNILGQTICSQQYNTTQVLVNVAGLPSGVYFVRVNGSLVRKFVKE